VTPFSCVKEQKIYLKILRQAKKNCSLNAPNAIGEQALSQARTFEWFKRFKDGRESVDDRKHPGRPSKSTTPGMIAKVRKVILQDRRQSIHDVCNRVGLSEGNVNAF
jgi:hypothetical protein